MSNRDLLIFLAGGTVGSIVTYFAVKNYFQKEMNESIEEMRQYVDGTHQYDGSSNDISADTPIELGQANKQKYHSEEAEVVDYTKYYKDKEKKEETDISEQEVEMKPVKKGPHVIWASQFEEDTEYSKDVLTYFKDGVVADNNDEIIPNGIELIGEENLDRFGEEEDNIMYIRNEDMCVDYEVVLEERTYEEYMSE